MNVPAKNLGAWLGVVALTAQLAGCGAAGGGGGHASPEAVAAAAKSAIDKKDMGAFYDCLTVESQNVLAGTAVMVGSMMKLMAGMGALGGPEAQAAQQETAEMAAVLEKHGLTDETLKNVGPNPAMMNDPAAIGALADAVKDKRALVHDVFTVLDKMREGDSDLGSQFTGELKDLKIEGDRATAKLLTPRGEEELDFHKTADGWRLHIDLNKINRGASPTAPPSAAASAEAGDGAESAN